MGGKGLRLRAIGEDKNREAYSPKDFSCFVKGHQEKFAGVDEVKKSRKSRKKARLTQVFC